MRRPVLAQDAELLRRIDEMPIPPTDRARARASFLLAEALVDRIAAAVDGVRALARGLAGAGHRRLPHSPRA